MDIQVSIQVSILSVGEEFTGREQSSAILNKTCCPYRLRVEMCCKRLRSVDGSGKSGFLDYPIAFKLLLRHKKWQNGGVHLY
jgi:hypothetical protein